MERLSLHKSTAKYKNSFIPNTITPSQCNLITLCSLGQDERYLCRSNPKGLFQGRYDQHGTAANAQALYNTTTATGPNGLDDAFITMLGWFPGSTLQYAWPIPVVLSNPPPYATWNADFTVLVDDNSSPWWLIFLVVAEVSEIFMLDQGIGWFSGSTQRGNVGSNGNEGTPGEALSRYLATEYMIQVGQLASVTVNYQGIGNIWLSTTSRTNYLPDTDNDNNPDARVACGVLFLHYLNTQLNFRTPQIVTYGAPNLVGLYKNLTGDDGDPFPTFSALLASVYPPGTTAPADIQDNPFPLAKIELISHKNNFGKSEVSDQLPQGGVWGDDILVELSGFSIYTLTKNQSLPFPTPTIGGSAQSFTPDTNLVTFDSSTGIQYENPNDTLAPQKIIFPYNVTFTQASIAQFPTIDPPETLILTASITTPTVGVLNASLPMMFGKGADPYFVNVTNITPANAPVTQEVLNAYYLSQDLRVFTVTPGINSKPVVGTQRFANAPTFDPNNQTFPEAFQYIQDLLTYMNAEYSDPTWIDPFQDPGSILPETDVYTADSSVFPYTYGVAPDQWQNFNFAIARVRLEAPAGTQVNNVRVFFRSAVPRPQTRTTISTPIISVRLMRLVPRYILWLVQVLSRCLSLPLQTSQISAKQIMSSTGQRKG